MIIVRTVREPDLDSIYKLAQQAYPGMTTLPPDRDILLSKLLRSINSVAKKIDTPADETYFLVMEDTTTNTIVGTAAVIACLGSVEDFYSYQLNEVTQVCKELDKEITVETLSLTNHFGGFAEAATLYLHEDYRKHGNGKLLARSRYLFMAQFRDRFPESVMADLRGYFDEQGKSPFWDAVGQHFFEMDFDKADLYCAIHGNQFIADLMPKHPLYVNLLPKSAQEVIGRPNVVGKPALKMLTDEGFKWNGYVDIFDAAPSVDTKIDDMKSIKNSHATKLVGTLDNEDGDKAMVATGVIESFATTLSTISVEDNGVRLPQNTIEALKLEIGDTIRYLRV